MSARLASKSAELGDVPEDWQVLPIGTISADIKTRNNSKRKLTVFAITKYHGLVPSLQYFKKRIFSEDLTNYKLVKKNQFVYSPIHLNEGAIGLLESENEGLVSPLHIVFELKPEASPRFFKYLLKSHRMMYHYSRLPRGSVKRRGAILFRDFSRIPVSLPPIEEQDKIVVILSSAEDAIQKTEEIISKTQQLKKGLVENLLTKGIGHTRFKATEIGELPENWTPAKLKDIIVEPIRNGYSPISPSQETGKWILTLGAVSEHGFRPDKVKPAPIGDPKLDRCKLQGGDILVSRSNTRKLVGLSGVYQHRLHDCYYPDLMMRVRVDPTRIDGSFVDHWLRNRFSRRYFSSNARGTSGSMVKITADILSELPIFLPELSEQRKIVASLSVIDEKINTEICYKESFERVKKALVHVLLTGKVRVKVN